MRPIQAQNGLVSVFDPSVSDQAFGIPGFGRPVGGPYMRPTQAQNGIVSVCDPSVSEQVFRILGFGRSVGDSRPLILINACSSTYIYIHIQFCVFTLMRESV